MAKVGWKPTRCDLKAKRWIYGLYCLFWLTLLFILNSSSCGIRSNLMVLVPVVWQSFRTLSLKLGPGVWGHHHSYPKCLFPFYLSPHSLLCPLLSFIIPPWRQVLGAFPFHRIGYWFSCCIMGLIHQHTIYSQLLSARNRFSNPPLPCNEITITICFLLGWFPHEY